MNRIDLDGRVAIVTGGAQGIGRAIAQRLVESGATVWIWDRDGALAETTARELGAGATSIAVDVTSPDELAEAARAVADQDGKIDILVNNAGISGANAPVHEYPVDEWRAVIEINLSGTFYCSRAVVPHMIAAGYGRIVNIASVAGKEGNPNAAAYSSSKAGVIGLTKSLGKELAEHDIAVNCITPAAARTALFDQMTEEHVNYMLSKIPRGRFVGVEEIAGMVAWLASQESAFATGAVFDLSGGRATY
jgi:NAD(P)-dependent dehydrogenase (short-subunit alcohol dehydrogenase family)